jgi:hypothetical protein
VVGCISCFAVLCSLSSRIRNFCKRTKDAEVVPSSSKSPLRAPASSDSREVILGKLRSEKKTVSRQCSAMTGSIVCFFCEDIPMVRSQNHSARN